VLTPSVREVTEAEKPLTPAMGAELVETVTPTSPIGDWEPPKVVPGFKISSQEENRKSKESVQNSLDTIFMAV